MIEHADSEIGILEENNMIVIGLAGTAFGERAEVSLQFGENPDEQDRQMGFDRLYIDYNQLGGYGVVKSILLVNGRKIGIILDEKAKKQGIPDAELAFNFAEKIDRHSIQMLEKICLKSGTELKIQ